MSKRGGFNLIELCVSMTAGSTLLVLAIGILHQSMSLAAAARRQADQHRTLNRLSSDFRHDVHRASRCIVDSPQQMRMVMSDRSEVRYQVSGGRISRQEDVSGGRLRRESYDCGEETLATFQSLDEPARGVLMISDAPLRPRTGGKVQRRIEAVAGRDQAHQLGAVSP